MFTTERGMLLSVVIICLIYRKKNKKKLCLPPERGMLLSVVIICFTNARKNFEETLWRLTFKYFEKVAEFSVPLFFKECSKPSSRLFFSLEVPLLMQRYIVLAAFIDGKSRWKEQL